MTDKLTVYSVLFMSLGCLIGKQNMKPVWLVVGCNQLIRINVFDYCLENQLRMVVCTCFNSMGLTGGVEGMFEQSL